MIGLDTNILARFLLKDDAAQYRTAENLLRQDREFTAPLSVILELVWVLESEDCDCQAVSRALRHLFALPNFSPLDADVVLRALVWYESGMDFGDALHLAASTRAGLVEFLTMDKAMAKRANREAAAIPVKTC